LKYFIDTEFIENGITIELISIGIVCDDGREYYALNFDCDFSKASDWVKENVLNQLPELPLPQLYVSETSWKKSPTYKAGWRKKGAIADEVKAFINQPLVIKPEFWTYYGAYDHVVLCQLFGTMMDLPAGFPMYTMDLKQWCKQLGDPELPAQGKGEHSAIQDARWNRDVWHFLDNYSRAK
jgi:hypothetical protein